MEAVDCAVVGAGPAGLAASAALTDRRIEHLVLERGRIGQTWRCQRWDSFRLNTPGWMNALLDPESGYATGSQVVARLEELGKRAPAREGVTVTRLAPAEDGFVLSSEDGEMEARSVVIAGGDQNVPRLPALARHLLESVVQCHAAGYRDPDRLPEGGVLVVGSAQSGCQIAEDLLAAGRRVVLSTSPAGRVPTPYRGRDTIAWLADAGFLDQRPDQLPDRSAVDEPQPVIAPGRGLSLQSLARQGAVLAGRTLRIDGNHVHFDDSTPANVAAADAAAGRVRGMIDELILREGRSAPPADPDPADVPVDLDPPPAIDLHAYGIHSVVWCTGFTGDFSWLDPALLDDAGRPRRQGAAGPLPGLWYLGLSWLLRRGSGLLYGMPGDAERVADAVGCYLKT